MMKHVWLMGLAGLLGFTLLAGSPGFGDDQQPKTDNQQQQKKVHKHTAKKPVGAVPAADKVSDASKTAKAPHLPAGWAKLDLTADQRTKAVAVMQKYSPQIKQLEAQIQSLRKQQHVEMAALLNDKQKTTLADAKTARAAKTAATKSSKAAASKTISQGDKTLENLRHDFEKLKTVEQGQKGAAAKPQVKNDKPTGDQSKPAEQPKASK